MDIGLLLFNNKGLKMEEITFNNPQDEMKAIEHLGDALSGGDDGDSETITCDLAAVQKRVYSVVLIATASTGSFADVSSLGCRVYQRFSKHRGGGVAQKEVSRNASSTSCTHPLHL